LVVLTEQQVQAIPLVTKITPLSGNQTTSRTPSFSFQTLSTYAPFTPSPRAVYFQVDTWQGPWTRASGSNPAFSGQTNTLSLGTHVLFAYATDGQDAGINGGAFKRSGDHWTNRCLCLHRDAGFDGNGSNRGHKSVRGGCNGDIDGDSDSAGHADGYGHVFGWHNCARIRIVEQQR
jgi:hypothetical protein